MKFLFSIWNLTKNNAIISYLKKTIALKVNLHEIFNLWFFSHRNLVPDSDPKFFSNINSNSQRYSNLKAVLHIIRIRRANVLVMLDQYKKWLLLNFRYKSLPSIHLLKNCPFIKLWKKFSIRIFGFFGCSRRIRGMSF